MTATIEERDGPLVKFDGEIRITSMPLAQNPDPTAHVMARVEINSSGTATGYGEAIALAARAFLDSLPKEKRDEAARFLFEGFLTVLTPGGAAHLKHGGLQS